MLAGLLAPLRLPERVLEALDQLRPMRLELTRVREQTEPLADLLPVLEPVGERLATIERTVQELAAEVKAFHETLTGVKDDIQRTTGLRGERGMMERARDVLTGGNQEQDRAGSEEPEGES